MKKYIADGRYVSLYQIPNFRFLIPEGENIDTVQSYAFVLDSVSKVMKRRIPNIGEISLSIVNIKNDDYPMCVRQTQTIYLNVPVDTWNQTAYQFAHELCHFAIPNNVPQKIRWIEESICETASLYFMRQVGQMWNKSGIPFKAKNTKINYAFLFTQYANNQALKFEVFDLSDHETLSYLESNCIDRPKNMHLARHLLPIFTAYPETWHAVPMLCDIHQDTLPEALEAWIRMSPEAARPGLRLIKTLFG